MDTAGTPLTLTMRSSWLSEYRNDAGALAAFDIAGHLTSFGMLCALIAQVPGVEFADMRPPARFIGPARLRFRGFDIEVTLVHSNYRITALDPEASSQLEELLDRLREPIARRARNAARRAG